jgi:hypothetical protein
MKHFLFSLWFLFTPLNIFSQDFINGDLEGVVSPATPLAVASGWQLVPYYDINCQANDWQEATPDLTDRFGPKPWNGIIGIPHSGNTFETGLFGGSMGGLYHEGIKQTVSGFNIGTAYDINFFQAVVKQRSGDYLDSSGCWAVYLGNTLIGTSTPTVSNAPVASSLFTWDYRKISFVANATSYEIKFLPADDDTNIYMFTYYNNVSVTHPYAGLRMGIDSIYITTTTILPVELVKYSAKAIVDRVQIEWTTATETNNNYFVIEKSKNNFEWTDLIKVIGAGNSNRIIDYSAIDDHPFPGISYYRLKQVDYDGRFTYSKTESVNLKTEFATKIYPNPASHYLYIENSFPGDLKIELLNSSQVPVPILYFHDANLYTIDVSDIPKGNYFLIMQRSDNNRKVEKIFIY